MMHPSSAWPPTSGWVYEAVKTSLPRPGACCTLRAHGRSTPQSQVVPHKGFGPGRIPMTRQGLVAIFVVVMAVGLTGQSRTPKKFLGGPLVIEDQGSFFVGGVQKVTDYATVAPPPAPGSAAATGRANTAADHHRPDVRAVPDPAPRNTGRLAGDHGARLDAYRRVPRVHAGRPRRLVSLLRSQGRSELRRRSGRTRTLGIRRVRHPRRRGHDRAAATSRGGGD